MLGTEWPKFNIVMMKMDNILIKDKLEIVLQILVIIGLHGQYCEVSTNPLCETLMMEFVEYQQQNRSAYFHFNSLWSSDII